jgi:hypothetical protein
VDPVLQPAGPLHHVDVDVASGTKAHCRGGDEVIHHRVELVTL